MNIGDNPLMWVLGGTGALGLAGKTGKAANASRSLWPSPGGSKLVDGIKYTDHALKRMAPVGLLQKGNQIVSRGVTPSVVKHAIQNGAKSSGNRPGTVVHTFENVRVVTNKAADRVITVIKTGR